MECNKIIFSLVIGLALPLSALADFSHSPQWLSVMHYEKALGSQYKSRVNINSGFFFSSKGDREPLIELNTAIEIFNHPEEFLELRKGHPQCLFPARYRILRSILNSSVKNVYCPNLEKWKKEIRAKDIAVIYAAQYLANPSSVMGHTFFKFVGENKEDFLNLSLGYAAEIPEDIGALDYVYGGIIRGFNGAFSFFPYYQKVHEYGEMEQRDIWEYKLNLSPAQVQLLTEHLWELSVNAQIDYLFLQRNCAFIILAATQVVTPDSLLLNSTWPYLSPIEAIKTLKKNGLIANETYRPSLRRKFDLRLAQLSPEDRATFNDTIANSKISTPDSRPNALDTLLDYLYLERQRNQGNLNFRQATLEREILLERSKWQIKSPTPNISQVDSPLNAHPPHHLELGGENNNGTSFSFLTIRPAVHVFMDKNAGFLPNSSFNFFKTSISRQKNRTSLSEFTLIDVRNRPDFSLLGNDFSWGFFIGFLRENSVLCLDCPTAQLSPEFGVSFTPYSKWQIGVLTFTKYKTSPDLNDGDEVWFGVRVENMFQIHRSLKSLLTSELSQDLFGRHHDTLLELRSETRIDEILRNFGLGLELTYQYVPARDNDLSKIVAKTIIGF